MNVEKIITEIRFLVSEQSQITSPLPGMVLAEIHLLPYHKVSVCHALNKLVRELDEGKLQIILAVIDDPNDRYVKLISNGLKSNDIDASRMAEESRVGN